STPAHGAGDDTLQLLDEPFSTGDYESVGMPTPSIARRSTAVAVQAVEILRIDVESHPQNWGLRRQLAEAMLEAGDRSGGLQQLDVAMSGAEASGVLDFAPDEPRARSAIDTLVEEEPSAPIPTPATLRAAPAPAKPTQLRPADANGAPAGTSRDFVNLGDWLRDDEAPRDTRMVVAEQEPTGDEQADFA